MVNFGQITLVFLENERLKWFGHSLRREHKVPHLCKIGKTRRFWEKEQRSTKKRWKDNIKGDMKKYRLTEDMAQDRTYWTTEIMAGSTQGDGQER